MRIASGLAPDRRLHGDVHVGGRQSVARAGPAVDRHEQLGLARLLQHREILDPSHSGHDVANLGGLLRQHVDILARQLQRVLTFHARHRFFDVVLDVLRIRKVHARKPAELRIHLLNELLLGESPGPLPFRFQLHEELDVVERRNVGAVVGAAQLRDDVRHARKAGEDPAGLLRQP